jgi:prolipoprotein diacylglyceryltransferase
VIPGAFLLGIGRIGNFIDRQIVGSVTAVGQLKPAEYVVGLDVQLNAA